MTPRISLAMPVYNGERFIETAIQSILSQTFEDFELVITDNASTDSTEQICRRFAEQDARIRYVRNPKNLGAGPNYNLGHELARGEYLKWCAHDDCISPNYIELAVAALDADREAVAAYGPSEMIDANGNPVPPESATLTGMNNPDSAWRFITTVKAGGSCGVIFGVFRRKDLSRSLMHKMYYSSDRALIAEMALLGRFVFIPQITFYNRAHPTRSMQIANKENRLSWQVTSAKKHALEHLPLLVQNFEIAWRHRNLVGLHRTLPKLVGWATTPIQLARYASEVTAMVAPRRQQAVRAFAQGFLSKSHKT